MRCKIRLLLCDNNNALADALAILVELKQSDPIYSRGLALQGDALFQMGKFEHALVIYHRGNRLRNGTDHDFRVGIQKATTSINNCLKNVRIVREIPAKRRISTWSFKSGQSGKNQDVDVFAPNAHPFKDDISGLKVILRYLNFW